MNYHLRKFSIAALAGCFLTASTACATNTSGGPDMLSYIPEDSPYVFAMEEALPSELIEKLEPATEDLLNGYQTIVRHAMQEELDKQLVEGGDPADVEKFQGLMDEVLHLMSVEGLREAGIESGALMAFYGHGMLPVFRAELTDEQLFNDAIARFEAKADASMSVAEVGGQSYRYFGAEEFRVLLATVDGQAVVTLVPTEFDDAAVSNVLGITKPGQNLANSNKIEALKTEYGFEDYMTGYIDVVRIADTFLGNRTGTDAALFEIFEAMDYSDADTADSEDEYIEEDKELSPTCKAEFLELAGVAPRIVFGYSDVSDKALDSSMIFELRGDIAAGLSTLPAPVPGLGTDPGGLFSFGMSLNPMALRTFYEERLDAIEADPFECEGLSSMQDLVASGRAVLAQPIPPLVYGFRGFVANVLDIDGFDVSTDTPPESVDATVLFAIENAESLLMMGAMFDPELAALNLLPDGKPVRLDMPKVTSVVQDAFAAMTQNAMSVSVGDGAEGNAAAVLQADTSDPSPFMSVAMDSKRYYSMVGDAMMVADSDEGEKEMPIEVRQAIRDVMIASGRLYERMAVDVRFTDRGIEVDGRVTLGE